MQRDTISTFRRAAFERVGEIDVNYMCVKNTQNARMKYFGGNYM